MKYLYNKLTTTEEDRKKAAKEEQIQRLKSDCKKDTELVESTIRQMKEIQAKLKSKLLAYNKEVYANAVEEGIHALKMALTTDSIATYDTISMILKRK